MTAEAPKEMRSPRAAREVLRRKEEEAAAAAADRVEEDVTDTEKVSRGWNHERFRMNSPMFSYFHLFPSVTVLDHRPLRLSV